MSQTIVTRENVEKLLDNGSLEIAMANGRWWAIRRNGATKRWKRDASRIRLPYKYGIYGYGAITEWDFLTDGSLNSRHIRVRA